LYVLSSKRHQYTRSPCCKNLCNKKIIVLKIATKIIIMSLFFTHVRRRRALDRVILPASEITSTQQHVYSWKNIDLENDRCSRKEKKKDREGEKGIKDDHMRNKKTDKHCLQGFIYGTTWTRCFPPRAQKISRWSSVFPEDMQSRYIYIYIKLWILLI